MTAAVQQLPLPHFLNLPLPPLPTARDEPSHQPLVFKLSLSPDQYEELLRLDADIEEGEEGGLRLEFDPLGKGKLHLTPSRLLLLNPPRSGPSRTNKPEEIYCHHTPTPTPSASRSPLTGLLRIPTSTCVYDLERPSVSERASASTHASLAADPIQPTHRPAQAVKNAGSSAELSHREKLAGQRLKEERLEEEQRKKEKQVVVLPDRFSAAPAPTPKRTRLAKSKAAPSKDQSANKQQPTHAAPNDLPASKNPAQAVPPVIQHLAPRRALPGSQTGKHLAHVHNQHLPNPPPRPAGSQPQSEPQPQPQPQPQPLPIPAPPAVVFKPPNSSRRAKPGDLTQPTPPDPAEPSSVTKSISAGTTRHASHSDEDKVYPPTQTVQSPTPPPAPLKHVDPPNRHQPPRADVSHTQTPHPRLADPAGVPPVSDRSNPPTSLSKRVASKRTHESAIGTTADDSWHSQPVENTLDGDDASTNLTTKKQVSEMLIPNPAAPPPSRPRKSQKRNLVNNHPTQSNPEPNVLADPPPLPSLQPPKTETQPRKPAITIERVAVSAATARNQSGATSRMEKAPTPPIARKRGLVETENPASQVLNKRVRQDEGGSGLPTIRKVVRAPVANGDSSSATHTLNAPIKKVKKMKKVKQTIDYTSSEVEEGEEPGEIVRSSARNRPPPPAVAAPAHEAAQVPKPQPNNPLSTRPTYHKPSAAEPPPTRPSRKTITTQQPPPESPNPPPPANAEDKFNTNDDLSVYHNNRLLFHKLSTHYEFVCSRLEEYERRRRKIGSLPEVEQLLFEAYGLEIELDRVRNQIIRKYSTGS